MNMVKSAVKRRELYHVNFLKDSRRERCQEIVSQHHMGKGVVHGVGATVKHLLHSEILRGGNYVDRQPILFALLNQKKQ